MRVGQIGKAALVDLLDGKVLRMVIAQLVAVDRDDVAICKALLEASKALPAPGWPPKMIACGWSAGAVSLN